jgi:hypothetical protein
MKCAGLQNQDTRGLSGWSVGLIRTDGEKT